jgi:DeoR family transcriptional regulator of aga operon
MSGNQNGNLEEKDFTLERRVKIIELLEKDGHVKVINLSEQFGVSEVTIRNDLAQLEEKGLLVRTRGGGMRTQRVAIDYQLNEKAKRYLKEKQAIGKAAAKLINENDTIIIDSGTTTQELAKQLKNFKNLTIITNALNIAGQFVNDEDTKVIMLGGLLRHKSLSLIGPIAETSLKNYFCDKLFIGVDGIDSHYGITTPNIEEAHLNRRMIEISKEVIVLTDSSKFLRRSFAHIATMDRIDTVITDSNIPEEELKNLRNAGVNVIIAN